jgi:hypothetical protein
MDNLKEFCSKFTPEELDILDKQHREFYILEGMLESLKLVENSLGKVHTVTIELRKKTREQRLKLITLPDAMMDKLAKGF